MKRNVTNMIMIVVIVILAGIFAYGKGYSANSVVNEKETPVTEMTEVISNIFTLTKDITENMNK